MQNLQSDFFYLRPKFSSISLGFHKPINTPDLRPRSANCSTCWQPEVTQDIKNMMDGIVKKPFCLTKSNKFISFKNRNRNVHGRSRNIYRAKMPSRIIDVRYSNNRHCNQNYCFKVKDRLNQNLMERHIRPRKASFLNCKEKAVIVVQALPNTQKSQIIIPQKNDSKLTQTAINLTHDITPEYIKDDSGAPLDTGEDVTNFYSYKTRLRSEIIAWLLNIPIFYSITFTPKKLKNNVAYVLALKINQLATQVNNENYKTNVKQEINKCLNMLPIWLPNTKLEKALFKNELRNKLYKKIKKLNSSFLNVKYDDKDSTDTESKLDVELEMVAFNQQYDQIHDVISNWLKKIPFTRPIVRRHVVELVMSKLSPLLNVHIYTPSYILMLKDEIIDILNELPVKIGNSKHKPMYISRYAEDLTTQLVKLQIQFMPSIRNNNNSPVCQPCPRKLAGVPIYDSIKDTIAEKVNKALSDGKVQNKNSVQEEICNVILYSIETLRSGIEINTNNEIYDILRRSSTLTEEAATNIAKKIKVYVKIALLKDKETALTTRQVNYVKSNLSGCMSVYPITSTPKQPTSKDVPRLNPEEISYMENVATLIRKWMKKLPKKFDDDLNYKETMISDLAGDIMDEAKKAQLANLTSKEKDNQMKSCTYRWLRRFNVFENIIESKPLVDEFLRELQQIPEPNLTAPQYGTRQAMDNIKRAEGEFDWDDDFVPKGIDILEDQISVWMNEQPDEIYEKKTKKNHEKLVKGLAYTIQDHLRNKSPEEEIENDIKQWLKTFVSEKEKENIGLLTQNLKEKVIHVPQDETLDARNIQRKKDIAEYRQLKKGQAAEPANSAVELDLINNSQGAPDRTMKEFIIKYIEHNYEVDDPLVRGALGELLILELRRLLPPTRKEVYDNFAKEISHDKFMPEKLHDVLEYIKIISDWLKNLPIHPLYNTPGHRPRVDYVNDLARNIQELEDKRKENSMAMDFDLFLRSIITDSMATYNIPVLEEHKENIPIMVTQLVSKIIANRSVMEQFNDSSISDIKEQNLSEFIEDYIRINGREIADDEVKLEAWTARLLEEVKKMIHDGADPNTLRKADVYEKFSKVRIPVDNPVERFSSEMLYIKEISNWMKNLPFLPASYTVEAQEQKILMVTALAQKIAARDAQDDPESANKELVHYINNWISELPLDPREEVIMPIVIQQLMNRIDKVNGKTETYPEEIPRSETLPPNIPITDNPGTHIVEYIEDWCNRIPMPGIDADFVNTMRGNIATNLYQKIVELNADPKIYNDDILFKDLLEDEIDTQFENIPQNPQLQNKRAHLKIELLNAVLGTRNVIKEQSAGDVYKHKLETTIDASIPNPVQTRGGLAEPGFEIYKNHLANMFILENFDHSDDEIKAIYEKRIKSEIDKYFESAICKSALPIPKEQLYYEIYGELYKVPMPKSNSIGDKVEVIKTRYEIDAWFENLPIMWTDNLSEQLELDKILSALAERIHDIEKNDSESDEKIRQEIIKWLLKLPLLPCQKQNINNYADILLDALINSKENRKYVAFDPTIKGKSIVRNRVNEPLNTSGISGPYNKSRDWTSTSPPNTKQRKSGDLIVEIVEDWCNQLPLVGNDTETQILKDDLSTKIVKKIFELKTDTEVINGDPLFDQQLNEELDNLMENLEGSDDFRNSKPARKHQLIESLKSVMPVMKEEKDRHDYKTELNDTAVSVLKENSGATGKIAEFNKLTNDIVDYFVEFNYQLDDNEKKQMYRMKIHDAVLKFFIIEGNNGEVDPLIVRNQLICELIKIPVPNNEVLKEIAEETQVKIEVEQFFKDAAIDDDYMETTEMKNTLAKRLYDIEKLGHTPSYDEKMNAEIDKCLNKLNKTAPPDTIDNFVNILKNADGGRNLNNKKKYHTYDTIYKKELPSGTTFRSKSQIDGNLSGQVPFPRPTSNLGTCPFPKMPAQTPKVLAQNPQVPRSPQVLAQSPLVQWKVPFTQAANKPKQDTGCYNTSKTQSYGPISNQSYNEGSNQSLNAPRAYQIGGQLRRPPYAYQECHANGYKSSVTAPIQRDRTGGSPTRRDGMQDTSMPDSWARCPHQSDYQRANDMKEHYLTEYQRSFSRRSPPPAYQLDPDRSNSKNSYASMTGLNQDPFNYEYFKSGPLLNSTAVPRPPVKSYYDSSHSSPPSSQPGYLFDRPQQLQTTPRSVQGEAQSCQSRDSSEGTPRAQFQRRPYPPEQMMSTVRLPGMDFNVTTPRSTPTSRRSPQRKPANTPVRRQPLDPGMVRTEEQRSPCFCLKKQKKSNRRLYCMIPTQQYCNDCGGYFSTWCKVPLAFGYY